MKSSNQLEGLEIELANAAVLLLIFWTFVTCCTSFMDPKAGSVPYLNMATAAKIIHCLMTSGWVQQFRKTKKIGATTKQNLDNTS